jgi:glycosyltransferase involved in cell wall biosynthesis
MKNNSITCVVPARNEAGHLREVISQVKSISAIQDIIIVEGGSSDSTWDVSLELAKEDSTRVRAFKQIGKGKFNAVQHGAANAKFSYLLVWDADGTVPLECTMKVIDHALESGHATMGDRLRGEIEPGAMRFANWVANWVFAFLWWPILRTKPSDMLCGTKIVQTSVITSIPQWLLKIDPYGDFALIANARFQGYYIHSVVVDYSARKYGSTNIHRWSGGFRLLFATFSIYSWLLFRKRKIDEPK